MRKYVLIALFMVFGTLCFRWRSVVAGGHGGGGGFAGHASVGGGRVGGGFVGGGFRGGYGGGYRGGYGGYGFRGGYYGGYGFGLGYAGWGYPGYGYGYGYDPYYAAPAPLLWIRLCGSLLRRLCGPVWVRSFGSGGSRRGSLCRRRALAPLRPLALVSGGSGNDPACCH